MILDCDKYPKKYKLCNSLKKSICDNKKLSRVVESGRGSLVNMRPYAQVTAVSVWSRNDAWKFQSAIAALKSARVASVRITGALYLFSHGLLFGSFSTGEISGDG